MIGGVFPQRPAARFVAATLFIVVCCILTTVTLFGAPERFITYSFDQSRCPKTVVRVDRSETSPLSSITDDTSPPNQLNIEQRNRLSRLLNEQKKMFGQLSCKLAEQETKGTAKVSANGGWCAKQSSPESTEHKLDKGFGEAVSKFLKGKHVGSFGDGPGAYRKYLESLNQVASYTAYDGAPFCETTTNGWVSFLDLTGPQYGLPAFDWVTSVEVGEHIPQEFEDVYLDNLVRHAKEGIILSWAVPGQDGYSHINLQPLNHVIQQMEKRGFHINKDEGEPLRTASTFFWLQNNIHVYRRTDPSSFVADDV